MIADGREPLRAALLQKWPWTRRIFCNSHATADLICCSLSAFSRMSQYLLLLTATRSQTTAERCAVPALCREYAIGIARYNTRNDGIRIFAKGRGRNGRSKSTTGGTVIRILSRTGRCPVGFEVQYGRGKMIGVADMSAREPKSIRP